MRLNEKTRNQYEHIVNLCVENKIELSFSKYNPEKKEYTWSLKSFVLPEEEQMERFLKNIVLRLWQRLNSANNIEQTRMFKRQWVNKLQNEIIAYATDRNFYYKVQASTIETLTVNKRNAMLVAAFQNHLDDTPLFTKIASETDYKTLLVLEVHLAEMLGTDLTLHS